MKIAIGSDHAGFAYKEKIKAMLLADGHTVRDFGTHSDAACDYPDFVRPAAQAVADGRCERGIVLGGSGNGEAIVANRIPASVAASAGPSSSPSGIVRTTTATCSRSASVPCPRSSPCAS